MYLGITSNVTVCGGDGRDGQRGIHSLVGGPTSDDEPRAPARSDNDRPSGECRPADTTLCHSWGMTDGPAPRAKVGLEGRPSAGRRDEPNQIVSICIIDRDEVQRVRRIASVTRIARVQMTIRLTPEETPSRDPSPLAVPAQSIMAGLWIRERAVGVEPL